MREAGQAGPGRPHRVDVVGEATAGLGDAADEDDRLPVGRERGFVLVVGAGGQRAGAAAEVDPVEIAQAAFGGGAALEDDVVPVGRELRSAVDLGAAGQLVLAGAVGAHRPDVAAADEGDLAPVGGEVRFAVGRVFGELVEVPFLGGEEAAFGDAAFFFRGHVACEKTTAPVREDGGGGGGRDGERERTRSAVNRSNG